MNKVRINSDVELKDRLVAINRVTKVTKGGRTFTFAAIVVVGDGNGVIGWGLGKAGEVTAAISKGTEAAKKNLVKVPVLKGTIVEMMDKGAVVALAEGGEGFATPQHGARPSPASYQKLSWQPAPILYPQLDKEPRWIYRIYWS